MNIISQHIRSICRPKLSNCKCKFAYSTEISKTTENPKATSSEMVPEKYDPKDVTKSDMRWRTPWHKKEANYWNVLRQFYKEDNNTHVLKRLQAAFELTPSKVRDWAAERNEMKDIFLQSYIPERNQILGNELAAAHFIVYRGGAVKFHNDDRWIKADKYNNYSLPKFYQEGLKLEAIDCTDMNLYYEGLVNLRDLEDVRWLSINGCEKLDDWGLDRISNIFSHSLVYLDLRNCSNITENGIGTLYKMQNLKILYLDDFLRSTTYEMTCLLLQEVNPSLDIQSDKVIFEIDR